MTCCIDGCEERPAYVLITLQRDALLVCATHYIERSGGADIAGAGYRLALTADQRQYEATYNGDYKSPQTFRRLRAQRDHARALCTVWKWNAEGRQLPEPPLVPPLGDAEDGWMP